MTGGKVDDITVVVAHVVDNPAKSSVLAAEVSESLEGNGKGGPSTQVEETSSPVSVSDETSVSE